MVDVNLGIYDYYAPGFIDPIYSYYQNTNVPLKPGWSPSTAGISQCYLPLNTSADVGCTGAVRPETLPINNNWNFRLRHAVNPAPPGFIKMGDNMCKRVWDQQSYAFYSDDALIPKRQFFAKPYYNKNGDAWKGAPPKHTPYANIKLRNSLVAGL